jgi:hypothetical protein
VTMTDGRDQLQLLAARGVDDVAGRAYPTPSGDLLPDCGPLKKLR